MKRPRLIREKELVRFHVYVPCACCDGDLVLGGWLGAAGMVS